MSAGNSIVYYMGSTTQTLSLTESTVTLDTTSQIDTDTFSVSSGVITVKEAGTYLVINHLAVDSAAGTDANRTSGESFLHVNNTLVAGAYTDGYIRRNSGDEEFSSCAYGIYEFSANDEVEMRQKRINLVGSDARIVGNNTTFIDAKTSLTIIKLNDDNDKIILEATASENQTLTADGTYVDQGWDNEIVKDSGFTHSEVTNNDEITLDSAGLYLAVYSNSWYRTVSSTTRTGAIEVLDLDGSIIPGTYSNNYIRGTQSSEQIMRGNNSAMTIFETTSTNQKVKLKSAREAGAITLTRYPLKSRLVIYKLNGDEEVIRVESTSTENMGSTTESTMTYDSTDIVDLPFSRSGNQIEVGSDSKYLFMQGVTGISATTARSGSYQFGRYNGVNNKYGTSAKYSRDTASMDQISPHWASIVSLDDMETAEARMDSLNATTTAAYRTASSGAFCGIDLATLGTTVSAQDVEPNSFANSQTFGSPDIDHELTANSFANSQTFGTHELGHNITANSFDNSQTFGTHIVVVEKFLLPTGIASAVSIGTHVVKIVNSKLYNSILPVILQGDLDMLNDTIKITCISNGFTYDSADEYVSDLGIYAVLSTELTGKTVVEGRFNCADFVIEVPSTRTIQAFVVYKDTGAPSTSPLIAYIDNAPELPISMEYGQLNVLVDSSPECLFEIGGVV